MVVKKPAAKKAASKKVVRKPAKKTVRKVAKKVTKKTTITPLAKAKKEMQAKLIKEKKVAYNKGYDDAMKELAKHLKARDKEMTKAASAFDKKAKAKMAKKKKK